MAEKKVMNLSLKACQFILPDSKYQEMGEGNSAYQNNGSEQKKKGK